MKPSHEAYKVKTPAGVHEVVVLVWRSSGAGSYTFSRMSRVDSRGTAHRMLAW